MDIYLIRHTEVAIGRSVAYGQSDVGLADNYEAQRDELRKHLPNNPQAILSSPLSRCRQLAQDLATAPASGSPVETAGPSLRSDQTTTADAHPPTVQFDDRLKEFHFGDWELVPWADISRDALDPWMDDFVNVSAPNGESFRDLWVRAGAFWHEQIEPIIQTQTDRPVFIVSHGGTIRALLCLFLDLSLQNAYRINLDYGAVTKLTATGSSYTIQYINR